ncbi:hypothetical protein [Heyndrickxia coagulans]|uniref:Uncharacterized protein n=1 Tax=Heyndrickxia coagulans TaxID=1398 RepID=A0AAW7CBV3_HEYCO|nr:hypothetical protein [Heyndrickxia coagulans]MDL5039659.1 hypothetical protein [Heyndrickxia coagulans]
MVNTCERSLNVVTNNKPKTLRDLAKIAKWIGMEAGGSSIVDNHATGK